MSGAFSKSGYWNVVIDGVAGVIRESNHWGKGIRSCSWLYAGNFIDVDADAEIHGGYDFDNNSVKTRVGFCAYRNFYETDGAEYAAAEKVHRNKRLANPVNRKLIDKIKKRGEINRRSLACYISKAERGLDKAALYWRLKIDDNRVTVV